MRAEAAPGMVMALQTGGDKAFDKKEEPVREEKHEV